MVPDAGAFFGRRMTWNIIFRERYKQPVTPYVLWWIAILPDARIIRGDVKGRRHEAMSAVGINRCQGTPWSEELDSKELHGAADGEYDREPRGSAHSCTRSQHNPSRHLRYSIMLVSKGVVFLHNFLFSCTIVPDI